MLLNRVLVSIRDVHSEYVTAVTLWGCKTARSLHLSASAFRGNFRAEEFDTTTPKCLLVIGHVTPPEDTGNRRASLTTVPLDGRGPLRVLEESKMNYFEVQSKSLIPPPPTPLPTYPRAHFWRTISRRVIFFEAKGQQIRDQHV